MTDEPNEPQEPAEPEPEPEELDPKVITTTSFPGPRAPESSEETREH